MAKHIKGSKEKIKLLIVDGLVAVLACAIGAFSLEAVLIPNGLTSGGITGLSRMVQELTGFEFSLIYYGFSFVVIVLVAIFLGFREVKKILFLTVLYPAVIWVFEQFDFQLLEESDIILAAIFCGVFGGLSIGLVFWRGYSFCGTDAVAKILKKHLAPHLPLGQLLLIIDSIIIISSAFIFGRNIALYALVTQVILAKTIDYVMFGFETKLVRLEIITDSKEEISDFVMTELQRGVTSSKVTGEYTKTDHFKLDVLCSPRESIIIRRFVAQHQPNAFMALIHVDTVWGVGHGFTDIRKE